MSLPVKAQTLDPVTFEVLKNAFVNIVDQMAEQIFRTCYSFVIYSRDFSSALCDPNGNTVMQGSGDFKHLDSWISVGKALKKIGVPALWSDSSSVSGR